MEENSVNGSLVVDKEYQEKNYKNIFPITRSKRLLVWLCDLVITFAITYLLFHYVSYLIFYYATGYENIAKEAETAETRHNVILMGNNLLFQKSESDKDFSTLLKYTFEEYTKSFVKDKTSPEQYDDKDVFRTYYANIRANPDQYIEKLTYYDRNTSFFNIDTTAKRATLKDNYVNLFKPLLTPGDEMSDEGKAAYEKFSSDYFLNYYADVIDDIQKNDLTYETSYGTISYVEEQNKINKANALFDNNIIGASFVAVALGFGITYFLIPLLHKERKTLSMMMMRIQRVSMSDFLPQNRKSYLVTGFTTVLANLGMLSLLALPQISVNYIFNLPVLFIISIASICLVLISGITMIFSSLNRSLSDMGSGTCFISNDDLDEVYRIKGYDV